MPVMTTSLSRGMSRLIFFRLCSEAPVILMTFSVWSTIFLQGVPRTPHLVGLVSRCAVHTLPLVSLTIYDSVFVLVHLLFSQTAQTIYCIPDASKGKSVVA